MSVSTSVQLPAEPATGSLKLTSLAGDGKLSPSSRYDVFLFVTGDATAGSASLLIQMDPRFTSLVDYVQAFVAGGAAAVQYRAFITVDTTESIEESGLSWFADPGGSFIGSAGFSWFPPVMPLRQVASSTVVPLIQVAVPNPGVGQNVSLQARIYNWLNIASESTPIEYFTRSMSARSK